MRILNVFLIGFSTFQALGQGFVNLGFESANVTPDQSQNFVPFADAFPGWFGTYGAQPATRAFYNDVAIGSTIADIWGPPSNDPQFIIEGLFTAVLQVGVSRDICSIFQSGTLPDGVNSVLFKASGTDFSVQFNGRDIPVVPLSAGANYTLYGGDISAFAGTSGELRLSALPTTFHSVLLDSISFSTQSVPEPSTFALFAAGAAIFGIAFNSKRRFITLLFESESSPEVSPNEQSGCGSGAINKR